MEAEKTDSLETDSLIADTTTAHKPDPGHKRLSPNELRESKTVTHEFNIVKEKAYDPNAKRSNVRRGRTMKRRR